MSYRKNLLGVLMIICGVSVLFLATQAKNSQTISLLAAGRLNPEPKTQVTEDIINSSNSRIPRNMTDEEVVQKALRYTEERFPSAGEKAKIVLIQRIKLEELSNLGLPQIYAYVKDPPPYALVVLKGNFDVKKMRGRDPSKTVRVKYVGYIYDLRAGEPTLVLSDPDGSTFLRGVLKDPNIPEPEKPDTSLTPTAIPMATEVGYTTLPSYGDVAPPVGPTPNVPPTSTPLPIEPVPSIPAYPVPTK